MKRRAIAGLAAVLALSSVTASLRALDLEFDVDFPRFSGFDATIEVNGQPCAIRVRIAPDEKGKYACVADGCTIDGVPAAVSGSVKPRLSAAGQVLYFYSASLKTLPEAGVQASLKVSGELTSGLATFKYSGPKGKLTLTDHAIDVLAELGLSIGSVSLSPEILGPGQLGGTGTMNVGLGNDSDAPGPLKVSIQPTAISISLEVGARKVAFKGKLEGSAWVGTLTVSAKPLKIAEPYSIPAVDPLGPPSGGGGGKCSESVHVAQEGVLLMQIPFINDSRGGSGHLSILRSPAGNIHGHLTFSSASANLYISGARNCLDLDLSSEIPLPATDVWLCLDVNNYDVRTNRQSPFGEICFTVGATSPFLAGRWSMRNRRGEEVDRGNWSSLDPTPNP